MNDRSLDRTPALERALAGLRGRLRALVVVHGLGTVLAISAAWLLFAFVADWGLHVPGPVRVLHSAVVFLLPAVLLWRELVRPLRRIPDRSGLAVLLEREDADLHQLLVSAADFQRTGADAGADPALVDAVLQEAETRVSHLRPRAMIDHRAPSLRLLAGLACVAVNVMLFAASPLHAEIFFQRLLGSDVPWPQRTYLEIEMPGVADVVATPEEVLVRVARGSDVPIVVRARGVAPSEVTLAFADGSEEVISRGPADTYRRVLRAVQQDLEFVVRGGDDRDGRPRIKLHVLQPPDVTGLAVRIEPPAYTGLDERLDETGDVEVLEGSRLAIHVLADPPGVVGQARVLPEDRVVTLESRPFPTAPSAVPASDADPAEMPRETPGLGFDLLAERSVRYRIELEDESGLTNPDPGLYGVRVVSDRPPEVLVVSPGRSDVETVAGGSIPLRVRVSDDFGVRGASFSSADVRAGAEPVRGELELRPLASDDPLDPTADSGAFLGSRRLTLSDLAGADGAAEGAQFEVEVLATDNREPEAGEGRSTKLRVRVVSTDEMMRRIQDRLARARHQASELSALQADKRQRVAELLDAMQSDDLVEAADGRALASALGGQRRASGDAQSLTRELAAIVETVLYAGLDEKAGPVLEAYDQRMRDVADRVFHADAWIETTRAYESGALGSAGLAGNLVGILSISLSISEGHAANAAVELERAQNAVDMPGIKAALLVAAEEQRLAITRIEDLLERLAEWDSFQSVLTLTRDLLDRQNALRDRTQRFAAEK